MKEIEIIDLTEEQSTALEDMLDEYGLLIHQIQAGWKR